MSYTSQFTTNKIFQLTTMSMALALAGCGGGDGGVDVIHPGTKGPTTVPVTGPTTGPNTPKTEADFFLQKITVNPAVIELGSESQEIMVEVKVVEKATGGAVAGKEVVLSIADSQIYGVTIEGSSTQASDTTGKASYTLVIDPNLISDSDKQKLIQQGIAIKATAKAIDNTIRTQLLTIKVNEGDDTNNPISDLKIVSSLQSSTVSSNTMNPFGDDVTVSIQAKKPNGAAASGVEAVLGIANIDGVSIKGGNKKLTDENGVATFTVSIDPNLSADARQQLINLGIAYSIKLIEEDGAVVDESNKWQVANPQSDYEISVVGDDNPLNAYGDMQSLQIVASPKSSNVPTDVAGAKASIALNDNPKGVTLSQSEVTLDSNGEAIVNLIVQENLTLKERQDLVNEGVSYTITLTEPSKAVTTTTQTTQVSIPEAQYKVSFDDSNKRQLSSSGGTAAISFRVNDKNGGPVEGQTVVASLSAAVKALGLITLDNAAAQTTDTRGLVTYIVRVPAGLTDPQKIELETIGMFLLGVSIEEDSGVSSTATSQSINIASEVGQSNISLTTNVSVDDVNVLGDSFKILVNAVQDDGGAAINQNVTLIIKDAAGVSVAGGNTLSTDSNGVAEFTVNLSASLSQAERDALVATGINYYAVLTEDDGTQSTKDGNARVAKPESLIDFASIDVDPVIEIGGTSNVVVKLANDKGVAITGKSVNLTLTNTAKQYGVTVVQSTEGGNSGYQSSQSTDVEGIAVFVVYLPNDLTKAERDTLKSSGIDYQLSYEDNGITYQSDIMNIDVIAAQVSLNVLNPESLQAGTPQYVLSNSGDLVTIKSQLINSSNNKPITNQSVGISLDNPELSKLVLVNGQIGSSVISASTNANGVVSFDVQVPNNLTQQQRDAISNANITATLTESVTGKTQSSKILIKSSLSEIALLPSVVQSLNLNGGEAQVQVIAQDVNGNVISGQEVRLLLPSSIAAKGIVVSSSPIQTTDNSGIAIYTIAAPSGLTPDQKNEIGSSFAVGVSTTDSKGNSETQTATVRTVQPNSTKETLTLGANKIVNTDGDTFKVFARIVDENGIGIASSTVSLAVAAPLKTGVSIVGSNSIKTNDDGIATYNLQLEPGANVDQAMLENGIELKATATSSEGVTLTQDYIVNVDTTTIDSYIIMSAADKTTLNTGGDQTNITFRVVDNQGGVLQGVPVRLSVNDPRNSGAALTTTSVVKSNDAGEINAGLVLGANSISSRLNHDIIVRAEVIDTEYDVEGNAVLNVRAEEQIILQAVGTKLGLVATQTSLRPNTDTLITTTLVDAALKPIESASMILVDSEGVEIPGLESVQTNSEGVATFTLMEQELDFDDNGNLRIFAKASGEVGGVSQTSRESLTLLQVSQAGISFSDVETTYSVNETQTLNLQLRFDDEAALQSLINKEVELQTTLGSFANGEVITTKTIVEAMVDRTTNTILVPVELTSSAAGTAVISAIVLDPGNQLNKEFRAEVDTRFIATVPAKMLLQSTRSVIIPGGSTEIVALVKDANDVPVEGVTIVFSRQKDSSAGRLSAATAVTNDKGEARVTYQANASSPIDGVTIDAILLNDSTSIGQRSTSITVSEEAVYIAMAFSDKLESSEDDIYYTLRGSIAVTDGSSRPVPNKEVSLKSFATRYAQGLYCVVQRKVIYQRESVTDSNGDTFTPDPDARLYSYFDTFQSGWLSTEDPDYNYILDKNDDVNNNGTLQPINPVTILGGLTANDGYTFVTDAEGKVDFEIRYPKIYSVWTQVTFDATTQVNGSENKQSFNVQLPAAENDIAYSILDRTLKTPFLNNTSPFGVGNQVCISDINIYVNENTQLSTVSGSTRGLVGDQVSSVIVDGTLEQVSNVSPAMPQFNFSFNKVIGRGSTVTVVVGESSATEVVRTGYLYGFDNDFY